MSTENHLKSELTWPVCPNSMKFLKNSRGAMIAATNDVFIGLFGGIDFWRTELTFGGRGENVWLGESAWGNFLGGGMSKFSADGEGLIVGKALYTACEFQLWAIPSAIKFLAIYFTDRSLKTFTAWKVSKCGVISGPHFHAFRLNTDQKLLRI